jgi:hypothetical protein
MSWSHKGYQIEIDDNGKFGAEIEDITIIADSLEEAKKKVESACRAEVLKKEPVALKVVGILSSTGSYGAVPGVAVPSVHHCTIIGINRTTSEFQYKEPFPRSTGFSGYQRVLLPDTPANVAMLDRKIALESELERVNAACSTNSISKPTGMVDAAEYSGVVKRLKESYTKGAK